MESDASILVGLLGLVELGELPVSILVGLMGLLGLLELGGLAFSRVARVLLGIFSMSVDMSSDASDCVGLGTD